MAGNAFHLGIDIGGTFTDITYTHPDAGITIEKHPTSPNPADTVTTAIDHITRDGPFDLGACEYFTHATTIAGNTLLERAGTQVGLLTTKGFRDTIETRDESRYDLYDVHITYPDPIPARHFRRGITERTSHDGTIIDPLDEPELLATVDDLITQGAEAIAVSFLHSYANDQHEQRAKTLITDHHPTVPVSVSANIAPQAGEFPRTTTTAINAYLTPAVATYLTDLETYLTQHGFTGSFLIMTSAGGLIPAAAARDRAVHLLESGPTAGALVAQHHGERHDHPDVLSFDMGGTTSKGCIIDDHDVDKAYEFEAARQHQFKPGSGYPLLIPNVSLIEFSAGGGSLITLDDHNTLRIGPESAGATPGPACYDRGGTTPTITDADTTLGYLRAAAFADSDIDLTPAQAHEAIATSLADPLDLSVAEAAAGVYRATTEHVANAFREHAAERGVDIRRSRLLAFGGAGPMHATAVARSLGIDTVVVPPNAGVLSSYGLLVTPKAVTTTSVFREPLTTLDPTRVEDAFDRLTADAAAVLDLDLDLDLDPDPDQDQGTVRRAYDLRFAGQKFDEELTLLPHTPVTPDALQDAFTRHYHDRYGVLPETDIVLTQLKLELTHPAGTTTEPPTTSPPPDAREPVVAEHDAYYPSTESYHPTRFLDRARLPPNYDLEPPCIVEGHGSTTVIDPHATARTDHHANLIIHPTPRHDPR